MLEIILAAALQAMIVCVFLHLIYMMKEIRALDFKQALKITNLDMGRRTIIITNLSLVFLIELFIVIGTLTWEK